MTEAPTCRIHSQPMKPSKFGGWYCPNRDAEGEYCREKVRPPKPSSIQPASSLLPKSDSHDVLLAACLRFAGDTFKGAGPEMADDAIALAIKAYSAMKAVA